MLDKLHGARGLIQAGLSDSDRLVFHKRVRSVQALQVTARNVRCAMAGNKD